MLHSYNGYINIYRYLNMLLEFTKPRNDISYLQCIALIRCVPLPLQNTAGGSEAHLIGVRLPVTIRCELIHTQSTEMYVLMVCGEGKKRAQ